MSIKEKIESILKLYPSARANTPFGGPHQIQELFKGLRREIEEIPSVKTNVNLVVKSSYGKGNWATVPWLAILDSRETDTTQDGTYIVLLFQQDGNGCQFKLAQGVTVLSGTIGRAATVQELKSRAAQVRELFPEMSDSDFSQTEGDQLEAGNGLARLYEASSIYSKFWIAGKVPEDEVIKNDVNVLLSIYERFVTNRLTSPADAPDHSEAEGKRIWAIAAGAGGDRWGDFLEQGVVAIGWDYLGDLKKYSNQAEYEEAMLTRNRDGRRRTNDSHCLYEFTHQMSVGDYVVAKSGRKNIYGVGEVISDYFYAEDKDNFRNIRKVKWLKTVPAEFPGTGTAIKTLTEITSYPTFVSLVKDYLELESNFEPSLSEEEEETGTYSVDNIIADGCFLGKTELESMLEKLRTKKNLILQGPPGTGKTWLGKRLAYALMGKKDYKRVHPVQFHANMSYEDFVRGWRPTGEGKLVLQDGPFLEAVEDAKNSSQPFVVVIEEINRGSPAQIFGEMLTLLEADKRTPHEALELTYRKTPGERVYIPSNLYVIGTMNVADRSLALVDLAFRRRFAFMDLQPNFSEAWKKWVVEKVGVSETLAEVIRQRVLELNKTISEDHMLGPNFVIGHSYFIPHVSKDLNGGEEWYRSVILTEIAPLLREYWFDSHKRVEEEVGRMLGEL